MDQNRLARQPDGVSTGNTASLPSWDLTDLYTSSADPRIEADRGRVALRYGPLLYNVEQADQADITQPAGAGEIRAVWRGDLLGGVMALEGTWADGRPLRAIPNFARMNRGGAAHAGPGPRPRPGGPESLVWMKALP